MNCFWGIPTEQAHSFSEESVSKYRANCSVTCAGRVNDVSVEKWATRLAEPPRRGREI
jgi:hypothetical protein